MFPEGISTLGGGVSTQDLRSTVEKVLTTFGLDDSLDVRPLLCQCQFPSNLSVSIQPVTDGEDICPHCWPG